MRSRLHTRTPVQNPRKPRLALQQWRSRLFGCSSLFTGACSFAHARAQQTSRPRLRLLTENTAF
eukprot:1636176-Alexandrium_andersonii.AAC.1